MLRQLISDPYDYAISIWAIWASQFAEEGQKWTDIENDDLDAGFFDAGVLLAEEICEYFRSNKADIFGFASDFKPSAMLREQADLI